MIQIMSALIFPALLVLLFTRVTYNHFVGLALTVALIAASVYKGYTNSWLLIIIDAFSLTLGLFLSIRLIRKTPRSA
ncbi:CsbA family protein [Peribacillus tepidiphilus]|uniref:CsbA family protein n=1 Tax=Peribacillus tepidiphilus TaxID=2652445 RepID=UPI0012909A35|nr:CsbA family protein [Peribacillus tepidiphilus]